MSEPYTPDEVELTDCYAHHLSEYAGEDYHEAQKDAARGIARLKADALREAALYGFAMSPHVSHSGTHVHEELNRRADRIEQGDDRG